MYRIDEIVPADSLHAAVVLHVRRLLRKQIRRRGKDAGDALAFLFGHMASDNEERWSRAALADQPLQAGAEIAAELLGDGRLVVELAHGDEHIRRCHDLLRKRKEADDCFTPIIATDLATLLELSRARELANAVLHEDGEERPLSVLIRGETGTGKELLARALHELALRALGIKEAPFEVLHVAGMSSDLLNDELFGHVKGAFTDAKSDRAGRLELADGGTLLIDEVGDLPAAAQLRLLRFLQDQYVTRQGADKPQRVRVRVIAATWRDLDEEVRAHRFRLDLLHRLRVGSDLVLPPLRERPGVFDDVVPTILRRLGHTVTPPIARSARDALSLNPWLGNLRELVGALRQALAVADGDTVRVEHLPNHLQRHYLAVPLHGRALGFLCDELDGQHLDSVHAAWRVEQVKASLAATDLPEPTDEERRVLKFLSFLDDTSDEHKAVKEILERGTSLRQVQARQRTVAEFWRVLLAQELPQPVRTAVEQQLDALQVENETREHEIQRVTAETNISQHPWLSLLNDLRQSALFREQPDTAMAGFVAIFNMLRFIAPNAVDQLREAYKNGGLAGVRTRIVEALEEKSDEEIPAELASLQDQLPEDLSREDWTKLAALRTMSAARKLTGFDPKTIKKYLAKHSITPRWMGVNVIDAASIDNSVGAKKDQ